MTRYSRIVRKKKSRLSRFIPDTVQSFIARRVVDATGIAFLLCGIGFLAALASYNNTDPSLNTAQPEGMQTIHNWMGVRGAYLADFFLQTLGLGAALFGIILAVWGVRILRRHTLRPVWLRFSMSLLAALLASMAFARILAGDWLINSWLGGAVGTMLLNSVATLLRGVASGHVHTIAAWLAGFLSIPPFLYALAVTRTEFKTAMIAAWGALCLGMERAGTAAEKFTGWVSHYNDPKYKPQAEKPRSVAAKRKAPRLSDAEDQDLDDEIDSGLLAEEEDEEEDEENSAHTLPQPRASTSNIKVISPQKATPPASPGRQTSFALETHGDWEMPPMELLQDVPENNAEDEAPDEEALRKNAEMLQAVLRDFNVEGEIVSIHPGPVVTLYELEPAPGVKTSRVIGLSDDIARSMSAVSVRCAVVPGRNVIGIEMPNRRRQTVYMRELLETSDAQKTKAHLPLVLGKDIGGRPIIADLAKMPHLLVAGTTGSGKSVAVNTMILSLLYRLPPEKCRFIMIDPKMLELSVYDDIPHLLSPVVTEPGKAVVALKWAVQEMEERYRAMSKLGVRNIEGYNERLRQALKKGETLMRKVQTGFDSDTGKPVYEEQPLDMTELPYIVIVVDEFADLMLVAGKDVENAVQRLAQMARAAGIHLIMATQRPSVDVITGIIKANFPTRISFQVTSKIDSRTILNEGGAEQLLGMGDMLYMASGGRVSRVHGPFVSDEDVESVVNFLKAQGEPSYITDVTEGGFGGDSDVMAALFGGGDGEGSGDELYDKAVALVAREQKASTSFIQRHLQIGYNRAATLIEKMEKQGVISTANHVGKREVLVGDYSDA